ncbi:UNVERIFIED_CONTAM: hypothetical protein Sradi_6818800 [Sesamum radiatum]|uniref:Uncharacterized protein n=1 Tax=Sesamum radiatum TaxID=300843 RepID=A0AAW2JUS3_SESRA
MNGSIQASTPKCSNTEQAKGKMVIFTLETVAVLSFLPNYIKHRVNELSPLRIMTLSPVISSPRLPEDEVVGPKDLTEWPGPDAVHGPWLEVHEDCSGNKSATAGFIIVDVDALKLEIGVALGSGRWNRCRARCRLLPRTWLQSGCRTGLPGYAGFHAFSQMCVCVCVCV